MLCENVSEAKMRGMGVEYAHGLFISDLTWRPTWETTRKLVAVLAEWGLLDESPTLYRLTSEDHEEIPAAEAFTGELPSNLHIVGEWIDDATIVENVVGPSAYGQMEQRYIASTEVILGSDFRVLLSEEHEFGVEVPPMNGRTEVEAAELDLLCQSESYPASWTTTPPKVCAEGSVPPPPGFSGVWRSGVVIDCHKDVPQIAEDQASLPAKGLTRALEKALGTKLVELGWYH